MSLGGGIRPLEHPVPGAGPLSSQRPRTLARHLGFALNQAVGGSSGGQFAITSSIPLSALRPKSCLAGAAARPNPHRWQSIRRFPRVRSSGAFGRRPLHRPINHAGPASESLHGTGRSAYPRRLRPRPTALHLLKIYLYGYSTAFSGLLFPNREQPPPPSFDDSAPAAVALHGWNARVAPREGGFDRPRYFCACRPCYRPLR